MIEYIQCFSRRDAKNFLHGKDTDGRYIQRTYGKRIAWIGITSTGMDLSPVREEPRALTMVFDDILMLRPGNSRSKMFDSSQACEIVRFIKAVHNEPEAWALCVHCEMGVARSGAIAKFAQKQYSTMDAEAFRQANIQIKPNSYVLDLLKAEDTQLWLWGVEEDEDDDS